MNILKTVIVGALIGASLFFIPFFVLRIFAFFLIIGGLIRLFGAGRFGRYRRGFGPGFNPAFADNIRNMSEEEYSQFKQRFEGGCGCRNTSGYGGPGWGSRTWGPKEKQ